MLARLLYGGGLALVAAQLLADPNVCGPDCTAANVAATGGQSFPVSATIPPATNAAFYGYRPSTPPASSYNRTHRIMPFPQQGSVPQNVRSRQRMPASTTSNYAAMPHSERRANYRDNSFYPQSYRGTEFRNADLQTVPQPTLPPARTTHHGHLPSTAPYPSPTQTLPSAHAPRQTVSHRPCTYRR
ncbi:hypothetical protein K239x_37650 [Planctomycetes bacterium K23_9]|uniref:Uncharacterized protein n=1 Tax=Stieleria marina TaxID=1930275 RepID=A0A517NX98_9BACT|nr:hypothetical protein K239x_37650 [Planctomycetes bacterium K23_9]